MLHVCLLLLIDLVIPNPHSQREMEFKGITIHDGALILITQHLIQLSIGLSFCFRYLYIHNLQETINTEYTTKTIAKTNNSAKIAPIKIRIALIVLSISSLLSRCLSLRQFSVGLFLVISLCAIQSSLQLKVVCSYISNRHL